MNRAPVMCRALILPLLIITKRDKRRIMGIRVVARPVRTTIDETLEGLPKKSLNLARG